MKKNLHSVCSKILLCLLLGLSLGISKSQASANFLLADITTDPNFTYIGNLGTHSYYRSNYATNWQAAHTAAPVDGGYLVNISSVQENEFVRAKTSGLYGSYIRIP